MEIELRSVMVWKGAKNGVKQCEWVGKFEIWEWEGGVWPRTGSWGVIVTCIRSVVTGTRSSGSFLTFWLRRRPDTMEIVFLHCGCRSDAKR